MFLANIISLTGPGTEVAFDSSVDSLIKAVSSDSITWTISSLSGETGVTLNGAPDSLPERHAYSPGCYKAALWLMEQMEAKGLEAELEPVLTDVFNYVDILPSGYGWVTASGWDTTFTSGVHLYRTVNAGAFWQGVKDNTLHWSKIITLSKDSMWGIAGTKIIRTSDAGQSFQTILDAGVTLNAISALNFLDCWAAGGSLQNGVLYSTTDGWKNYKADSFPGQGNISQVDFISRDTGWLVTSGMNLARTTDGGENLTFLHPPVSMIHNVEFVDSKTGYILGELAKSKGRLIKTKDAGDTWEILQDSLDALPWAISIPGRDTLWVACDSGLLCVSFDAGHTWSRRNLPTKTRLLSIDVNPDGTCCIAGNQGLFYSTDLEKWKNAQVTDGNFMWNVVARLAGGDSTEVLITSHYDARSESDAWTPGADDNASGVATVMEAARLLAGKGWKHSLRFICFGGEEVGMFGSRGYAYGAYERGDSILAVLNADMVGYDGNKDRLVEIDAKPADPKSAGAAKMLEDIISTYEIGLDPVIHTTDSRWNSDHSSFWLVGVPALLQIEDRGDFNPFYHSTGDRLKELDPLYLTENVRAAVGWMAVAANLDSIVGTKENHQKPVELISLQPVSTIVHTSCRFIVKAPSPLLPKVFDASGRVVRTFSPVNASAGSGEKITLDLSGIPAGVYWVVFQASGAHASQRIVLLN
jgi:photosystem II stability/assembly factor-like uncharacterized protein